MRYKDKGLFGLTADASVGDRQQLGVLMASCQRLDRLAERCGGSQPCDKLVGDFDRTKDGVQNA